MVNAISKRKLLWLAAGLVVLAGIVVLVLRREAPPLRVSVTENYAVVDVSTLGEYPTTIKRVRLSDLNKHKVVWEVDSGGSTVQIHGFRLANGANPVNVQCDYGSFRVTQPSAENFILHGNTNYRLEVWGSEGVLSRSTVRFSFPRT